MNGSNKVFVSAAPAWEMTFKKAIGKASVPPGDYLAELKRHRFTPLDITTEHALAIETPADPSFRPGEPSLVAQALVEKLTLVTHDDRLKAYPAPVLAA